MQPVAELFASLPCCCSQTRPKRASPPEGIVAISFRRVPMRLAAAVIATVYLLPAPSTRLLSLQALAAETTSFTRQVSPSSETNATEPSVAVDRSDGTEWVAWQASGTHVARSDEGGHTFVQTPISNLFGSDVGDVDIRVGGPTPCSVVTSSCSPGTHRVYVSSLEKLPLVLQTHVAYSDDRGATFLRKTAWPKPNPSAIRFRAGLRSIRKPAKCTSNGITADPVANTTQGCNITQIESFH